MGIWLDVGGSIAICICTHTSFWAAGTCIHTFAGFAHLYIPRFRAKVRVYTPWQSALVDLPRFVAQVRVYTPWQFALVDLPRFEARVRVYTPWQFALVDIPLSRPG